MFGVSRIFLCAPDPDLQLLRAHQLPGSPCPSSIVVVRATHTNSTRGASSSATTLQAPCRRYSARRTEMEREALGREELTGDNVQWQQLQWINSIHVAC